MCAIKNCDEDSDCDCGACRELIPGVPQPRVCKARPGVCLPPPEPQQCPP
jgi:hypothetical protein